MTIKTVNNIGVSSPADFDFLNGLPVFLSGEDKLIIVIHNGSELTSVELPVNVGDNAMISEIVNPMYSLFKSGARGAVYRVSDKKECFLNVTYDGVYVLDENKEEYYAFDEDYEGLAEVAELYGVEVVDLYNALDMSY